MSGRKYPPGSATPQQAASESTRERMAENRDPVVEPHTLVGCGCPSCRATRADRLRVAEVLDSVSASNSAAVLTAELVRTRTALREMYRVFVLVNATPSSPSTKAAIREAGEVLGLR